METVFWSRLKQLCDERNTNPTRVCKEIGISTGSPPGWKRGRLPSRAIIDKFAEYFNVDPGFFVEAGTENAPGTDANALAGDELLAFALYGMEYKSIPKEKIAEIRRYAEFIKDK